MTSVYSKLAIRIRRELVDLEHVVRRAVDSWTHGLQTAVDQDVYLESVALNLHGFYSGLERRYQH